MTVTHRLRKKHIALGRRALRHGHGQGDPRGEGRGGKGQSAFRHSIWGIVVHKEFEILRECSLETCIPKKKPEHVIKIAAGGPSSAGGREGGGSVQAKLGGVDGKTFILVGGARRAMNSP